jgi:hypothetical protein
VVGSEKAVLFLKGHKVTSEDQTQDFEIHFDAELSRDQIQSIINSDAAVVKNSGIMGSTGCMVVGTLGVAAIGAIAKVLTEIIKSRNDIEIKYGDKHFKGLSADDVLELLKNLEDGHE